MMFFKNLFIRIKSIFIKDKKPLTYPLDPTGCKHEEWSSRYDYKTYPGSVKVLESYCLKCGTPSRGSGQ